MKIKIPQATSKGYIECEETDASTGLTPHPSCGEEECKGGACLSYHNV